MKLSLGTSLKPLTVFSYSSLTDIVLLLLIFFLLTSSFIATEGLKVNLPQAEHGTPAERSTINVTLTAEGEILINDAAVAEDAVASTLAGLVTDPATQTVVLSSDRTVPLERAVLVMDAAKGAGATRFFISTFPEEAGR